MKRLFWGFVLAAICGVSTVSFAEVTTKAGGAIRARYEFWKNTSDLNSDILDNRGFFRFRTSLWGQISLAHNYVVYAKLTNENKAYTYWKQASGKKGYHYDINETVFDSLYVDVANVMGLPVDIRFGRQELAGLYGENFIFSDGTPEDGSRTAYFNALKISWRPAEAHALDVLCIKNNTTDDTLPIINRVDGEQKLNATDEYAYALYYKNTVSKKLTWESYYVYKYEEGGASKMAYDATKLNTLGVFAQYDFGQGLCARGQYAGQFGRYGDYGRSGFGGYAFIDKAFKNSLFSPQVSVGYMYLSGDDRSSEKNEAWDPLFSRDTALSSGYSMTLKAENGPAYYWTNMQMYRVQAVFSITPKLKKTLIYSYMRALETVSPTSTMFGAGKKRGEMLCEKIDYAFSKNITGYVMCEYFEPGDFYVQAADPEVFFRVELSIKF